MFATDNACTHGNAKLCDGFVEGHEMGAPLFHQVRFDLRTGVATLAPCTQPIKVWPVKVAGGRIWRNLDE